MKYIGLMLTAALVLIALALAAGVSAAPIHAAMTPEPCVLVGETKWTEVWRCVDWEMGKVIYVNNFGMIFAVDE